MSVKQTAAGNPLGTEKIGSLLRSYAIPGIISMVVNSLYNMVDQIFIGQGVGMLGNGATNIIAPISQIAIALSVLFGDGLATYFSLKLGEGRGDKSSEAVGNAVITGGVAGILLTAVVYALLRPLCLMFGATENILPYALDYGRVITLGFPFLTVSIIINGVIRADGSPKYSMVSMMAGSVLNFVLDPLFIFVFGMGVKGAALATIISQALSCALNIVYLFRFKTIPAPFGKKRPAGQHFALRLPLTGRLMSLGVSSFLNNLTSTLIGFVSNNLFTHYGAMSEYGADIPLTVFGLCMKVSMLFFSVAMGFASAGRPILGFNYGAGKIDRVKKTVKLCMVCTTAVLLIAWICYEAFPLQLIRIFGTESGLYEQFAVKAFRVYLSLSFLGGVQLCSGSFFQSIGKPFKATVISMGKQLIFYIPSLLIFANFFGLDGLLYAGPVSELLAFITAAVFMSREWKHLDARTSAAQP